MSQQNTLQTLQDKQDKPEKPKFSQLLAQVENKNSITSMIGNQEEASKFISNISSAVAVNPQLQTCSFPTIVSAGLLANALKLSLSPLIGHCYLVPFKDTANNRTVATFILGWKGYLQLALRSGYYDQINVTEIKEGELEKIDPIEEIYIFKPILDDEEREKTPTVGYYAFFRYNSAHGSFRKSMYWSKKKMLAHADKYSKAFHVKGVQSHDPKKSRVSYEDYLAGKYPKADEWKYSSFWYASFDEMAKKTMLRQLISKWGIMSTDFQRAYELDNTFNDDFNDDANKQHVDNISTDITTDAIPVEEQSQEIISISTESETDKPKRGRKPSIDKTFFDE